MSAAPGFSGREPWEHIMRIRITSRRLGLSLVEILVVIAIVGVLVASLIPALSKARLAAQNAVGQANFQSIGRGVFTYAGDYAGWAPAYPGLRSNEYPSYWTNYWDNAGQRRGLAGHTIWEGHNYWSGRPTNHGATGLGILPVLGYIQSQKEFFHPVMRTYYDTSGGSSKHWWNAERNFGLFQPDSNIIPIPGNFPGPTPLGSGSNWIAGDTNTASGSFINCNFSYRNGSWLKHDGVFGQTPYTNLTLVAGVADAITNNKVDTTQYNQRLIGMGTPYENQFNRQGGQLDTLAGDGSVSVTKNAAFATPNWTGSAGTPSIFVPANKPSGTNVNPTSGDPSWTNGGAHGGIWMYIVEHDRGIW